MKTALLFLSLVVSASFIACKDDDSRTCISCSSDQTPNFELCQEPNGNAAVNGQDTGVNYETYLEGLQDVGTNCGG